MFNPTSWPEECACAEPAVWTLGVECSCEETEPEPSGEAVLPDGFWFQGFINEGCLLEADPKTLNKNKVYNQN